MVPVLVPPPLVVPVAAVVAVVDDAAEVLVLAMPSSNSEEWAAIGRDARDCGLEVLNLPPVTQLFGNVTVKDFKPVSTQDLLGRDQVRTGLMDISNYLSDKRVLVTGAGGSIGSELCRQIRQFNPASLVMLDIDDTAIQELQLSLDGHGLLDNRSLVIASVRDSRRMLEVFKRHRPQVVFHAAALKHLPLLEQNPDEGFKTNTLGTLNVLEAAAATGVERVVNVSTDKAADPTNLEAREDAEQLITAARVAASTTRAVEAAKPMARGGSRGLGLKKTYTAQVENPKALLLHYWDVNRDAVVAYLTALAQADVDRSIHTIPGVTVVVGTKL